MHFYRIYAQLHSARHNSSLRGLEKGQRLFPPSNYRHCYLKSGRRPFFLYLRHDISIHRWSTVGPSQGRPSISHEILPAPPLERGGIEEGKEGRWKRFETPFSRSIVVCRPRTCPTVFSRYDIASSRHVIFQKKE